MIPDSFSFIVYGKCVPKARPRLGRRGRVFTPQKSQDYEALVAASAREACPEGWPVNGEYALEVVIYNNSNVYGDVDNCLKSIADGLNNAGCVWEDDKYVSRMIVERVLVDAEPYVNVRVSALPRQTFKKKVTKKSR